MAKKQKEKTESLKIVERALERKGMTKAELLERCEFPEQRFDMYAEKGEFPRRWIKKMKSILCFEKLEEIDLVRGC